MLARAGEAWATWSGWGQDSGTWAGAQQSGSVCRGEGLLAPRADCPDHSCNRTQACFVSLWGYPRIPKSEPRMLDKGHQKPSPAQAKSCRGSSRYGLHTSVGAQSEGRSHRRPRVHPDTEARQSGVPTLKDVFRSLPTYIVFPSDAVSSAQVPGFLPTVRAGVGGSGGATPRGLSRLKFPVIVSTSASPSSSRPLSPLLPLTWCTWE